MNDPVGIVLQFLRDDGAVWLLVILVVSALVAWIRASGRRYSYAAQIRHIQERREDLRDQFVGARQRKKRDMPLGLMSKIAQKMQLVKKNQMASTQALLIQAGIRSKDAIYVLAFFRGVLPLVLGAAGLLVTLSYDDVSSKWKTFHYIWPVLGAYIGLKLPGIYVRGKKKSRNARIQKSLPDVLDLMTICAESGLSLVSALDRVARELKIVYPDMADELSLTSIEIGFLPERARALLNLAERCDLPEMRGMVSVLIQTEKYGTPIAQALRVLSSEFRQARMLRAEQKAARLPAIMTVPMIVFILPTLFIVIIAPAVVKLLSMD